MNKELFNKFKSEPRAFLFSDDLDIRITHAEFEQILQSHEFDDKGTLYIVQKYPNSLKRVICYMTMHMILKKFKKHTFKIGKIQRGA